MSHAQRSDKKNVADSSWQTRLLLDRHDAACFSGVSCIGQSGEPAGRPADQLGPIRQWASSYCGNLLFCIIVASRDQIGDGDMTQTRGAPWRYGDA